MMTAVQDVLSCISLLEIWEGTIPELEIQRSRRAASWQQAPFNLSTNYIGHYHNRKGKVMALEKVLTLMKDELECSTFYSLLYTTLWI